MNRIENAITQATDELTPLESVPGYSPVLTPVLVAAAVGFAVFLAIGTAEGNCAQNPDGAAIPCTSDMDQMSVGDLLQVRHQAII